MWAIVADGSNWALPVVGEHAVANSGGVAVKGKRVCVE